MFAFAVTQVLDAICATGVAGIVADGKDRVDEIDPIGWKLFQWVIHSNRYTLHCMHEVSI
jgi:hypothetical protein